MQTHFSPIKKIDLEEDINILLNQIEMQNIFHMPYMEKR